MLSRGDVIAPRGIHHHDAFLAGSIDINVLEADASPANNLELARRLDQFGGDFRAAANDPTLVIGNNLLDLWRLEPQPNIHLEARGALKYGEALRRQRVRHEDFCFLFHSVVLALGFNRVDGILDHLFSISKRELPSSPLRLPPLRGRRASPYRIFAAPSPTRQSLQRCRRHPCSPHGLSE